ncbi:MAG: PfkB family carbohydrate kinase [Rubrimonas sp.]|uniref:PfkB family carbohydrate kinase n=1 Tax=Rubrimonas sp. TaxID=2036015 RepID=UPI002FDD63F3
MESPARIICFGAAHWDVIARAAPGARGPDAPGFIETRAGGVALNVALGLAARGASAALVSARGDDAEGAALAQALVAGGVDGAGLLIYGGAPTGRYVAIERADGELIAAVAETSALDAMAPAHLDLDPLKDAAMWFLDANLPQAVIRALACAPDRPPLSADAVSQAKAAKLRPVLDRLDAIYCNRLEAEAICATGLGAARAAAEALAIRGARRAIVTDGPAPAADAGAHGVATLRPEQAPIRSATGAGDALIAAHLAAWLGGAAPAQALAAGLAAARLRAA